MGKGFNEGNERNKPLVRLWAPRALAALLVTMGAAGGVSCGGAYDPSEPERINEQQQMLGSAVTVSFQDGVLPTSSYAGTQDASMKQATATTNVGAATTL